MSTINMIFTYGLIASGALPVLAYLTLPKSGKEQVSTLIIAWFATRVLADTVAHVAYVYLNLNVYPVFHVSICIEFTLLMLYFVNVMGWNRRPLGWMLTSIPLVTFLVEITFVNSIFELEEISIAAYFLVIAMLYMSLMFNPSKWNKKQLVIILSFFIYHAFLAVFGIFHTLVRTNYDLFKFIYPFFWTANLAFNLFFAYYFWTFRKLEKGSIQKTP
jgi:hypothetical protein